MIESDHNEIEEGEMDTLRLSSDSADNISKKRPRDSEDSEDEIDLSKKRRCSFSERSKILESDNSETISEKNNTERYYEKVEKYKLYRENQQSVQEVSDSDMNGKNKEKQGDDVKRGNEKKTENNITLNKNSGKINIKEEIVESMVRIQYELTLLTKSEKIDSFFISCFLSFLPLHLYLIYNVPFFCHT